MNQNLRRKQYTLTKKGWVVLSILIVTLVSVLFFSLNRDEKNMLGKQIKDFTTNEKLSNALKNKEISIDEYVLYSAYSLYDYDKLDEKYKSNSEYEMAPDLYTLVKNYENDISEETKEYINEKIQMKDIILGPETDEVSYNTSNIIPISNVASSDVRRLDKYVLSTNGKFVVWYTTNDTIDKTTDEIANIVANYLEEVIGHYLNEYGINFKFEHAYLNGYNKTKYMEFLKGIDAANAELLFNAMPIYITASNLNGNASGYYQPIEPSKTFNDDSESEITGIPIGPYINIDSNDKNIDNIPELKTTLAHELFHHYQRYICGEGKYKYCEYNNEKNGDPKFISETTADWAAYKLNNDTFSFAYWNAKYLNNYYKTIDNIDPYYVSTFLLNYENTVDNGKRKILNALVKKYHKGDVLKYLYNASDGKMPEVMNNLSKNNLINNYQYEIFQGYQQANWGYIIRHDINNKPYYNWIRNIESSIEPIAMEYFHLERSNTKFKIQNLSNNNSSYINIFTLNDQYKFKLYNNNLTGYKDIKVIYSQKFTDDVIIDFSQIDADRIMVSITNGSLDTMNYKVEETNENTNIELDIEKKKTEQVYDIYVDWEKKEINNFALNRRAFVDIYEFCSETKICEVSYTDETYNKVLITSTLKTSNNSYKYSLINEKQKQAFNSTLTVGSTNFDLSQLNVDIASCPEGKDSRGFDIPKCNETSFYVPIRFVTQALGYDVEWKEAERRIEISSGLQIKLVNENNIRTVLSKDKIKIGETITNIIELGEEVSLEKNTEYYAYATNKENKRVFNSGFSLISGNKTNFEIRNLLDESENSKTTYSILKTGNISDSSQMAIVTTITIPSDNNNSKAGIYPVVRELKINIK